MPTNAPNMAEYDAYIECMRQTEYPMMQNSLYLDHAGTTLYSKTLIDRFHADMMASLLGNPHSASPSSLRSTQEIEAVRIEALQLFDADPEHFDLVFTANTTAAIKLVMEAFRGQEDGFWYGYHVDSHTSLVGVRESARSHRCFESDQKVELWLNEDVVASKCELGLFAYPAQSNMNGRRLPLHWIRRCHGEGSRRQIYTLLDAAAYAPTSPLSFSDVDLAPDFTVVSFTKMFGFPDLGALIVKKDTAHLFEQRKYFGGGTVDMVVCLEEQWHAMKSASIHDRLEDGTLPTHSILALKSAMQTHQALYHSFVQIAEHTTMLLRQLYQGLASLRHTNSEPVCRIYADLNSLAESPAHGPTIAFNIRNSQGRWISNAEVEKLASVKDIHLRTGGLCNPGGVATCLSLAPWEMRENFSAGLRCGSENDILNGKPTGVIRVSLGAMSIRKDVDEFVSFVKEFFVETVPTLGVSSSPPEVGDSESARFCVESLTVYPVKSCGGWQVPYDLAWDVGRQGLAWDREWCIVKLGTGAALSQKAHARMALIRPHLDFARGVLRIRVAGSPGEISVPLSRDPKYFATPAVKPCNARVCGDSVQAHVYTPVAIADFFTKALGVPCTLARVSSTSSTRRSKGERRQQQQQDSHPILLSNESPILTISRSSLNRLNESIKSRAGKAAHPSVFRANIVLAESPLLPPGQERPWAEDDWHAMTIGAAHFDVLGGCRRCQMVCIDQESGEKDPEPFVTLAKTRRVAGRVLFGVHTALRAGQDAGGGVSVRAGDVVRSYTQGQTGR